MERSYAAKYHQLEENHWWFLGRRDIIYRLLKHQQKDSVILDIGCSGCALLSFLHKHGFTRLHGIDINEDAIDICRQRGIKNVHVAHGEKTDFRDQQFDIVIASDILEHIQNESSALSEWHRILKTDGTLIVFVPAFQFLWNQHDEVNFHQRRFTRSDLIEILQENGFSIKRSSYWNFILFMPVSIFILLQKILSGNRKRSGDRLRKTAPLINRLLAYLLKLENRILSTGINFAFGISVFSVARKV